ncbi:MAG TPA: hypothetical protein PLM07_10630 [Candidatus Rifleibacterium sp.]|nr:hypothetical protein [Candidatus Rifleibacterium sp.]HPT46346.1 hypothetical protein [Candidatus Rifleibacterium sp.]
MSINKLNGRRGSGYLIVLGFAGLLLIFFGIFFQFKSGHQQLQSKDVRRFVASNLGEAALNCIIAELNANRAFNTHRYFRDKEKYYWTGPIKKRESLIGKIDGIGLDGVNAGIYSGSSPAGEFKARFANVWGARENSKTETLKEAEMYTRAEIVVKVGAGWGIKEQTCRKITALIERRYPATESLLFDGEFLDLGSLGPYPGRENQLRTGRLYGYHWITFNTAGGACRGSELLDMEKIETPGLIRALKDTRLSFADNSDMKLNSTNDSIQVNKFETHDGFLLDGAHGAHPIKLARLPRERIKATAERYRKSYGLVIDEKTLPAGNYKNPYDTKSQYVDLDFGDFKVTKAVTASGSADTASGSADTDSGNGGDENEEEVDETDYNLTSDEPEIIRKLKGDKILIYAEVPLRIWGCPDRTVTIYSTKDIVIGGDFNQNPRTVQVYKDDSLTNYKFSIVNGKGNHKVGALIMSEGRVLIDVSRPTLFARNEIKPFFLYSLAMAMNPSTTDIEAEIKTLLCPFDPDNRKSLIGLGELGADGNFEARFGAMAFLYNNKELNGGGLYQSKMEDVINFFTPGASDRPRFAIKDEKARNAVIETLKNLVRVSGDLTMSEQDQVFDQAWQQAVIEENTAPMPNSGAMGLMRHLFEEAKKDPNDAIYLPEITINAALVSSACRSSRWQIGNSPDKVDDEIGNAGSLEYMREPGFIIQRVYGGVIRLAAKKPEYFMSGAHTGKNILRRRLWDPTNLRNRHFKPLEAPAVHNLLTFSEESISVKEYDNFSGKN